MHSEGHGYPAPPMCTTPLPVSPQSPGHQRFGHRPAGSVQGKKEVGQWGPEELDVQYRFVCFMMVAKLVRSYVVSKKQAKIG